MLKRRNIDKETYISGLKSGNRVMLGMAITLIESKLDADNKLADEIIDAILPNIGKSCRIGITGVPGVGKSTFIEAFGAYLVAQGHKVAVLAIDPSSQRTKGSILGDKTRMEKLSNSENAFIRPSPTGAALGGVANKTRETMLLCEAAGFDIILIETVGVGQSEVAVHSMVDFFLMLALAGAGDELQGIKKGIVEMADAIVINKADGENEKVAKRAMADFKNALHFLPIGENGWHTEVLTCSALNNSGIAEIWQTVQRHNVQMVGSGHFAHQRAQQQLQWFDAQMMDDLRHHFMKNPEVEHQLPMIRQRVLMGDLHPKNAARELVSKFIQQ